MRPSTQSDRLASERGRRVRRVILGLALVTVVGWAVWAWAAQPFEVQATVETALMPGRGDADDPAIWIHPTDPARSLIIGTNKLGGLAVYDMVGKELQYIRGGRPNNVDVRYGFSLGGKSVDIACCIDLEGNVLRMFRIDGQDSRLEEVTSGVVAVGMQPAFGMCLYHSARTGRLFALVNGTRGQVEQWELADDGQGKVGAKKTRALTGGKGGWCEGMVADDEYGVFYLAEEAVGIWRIAAEPDGGNDGVLVDKAGPREHLVPDVEGLAIYETKDGKGYLVASSQGSSEFAVYDRVSGDYAASFKVVAGKTIGPAAATDGIEVASVPLGPGFEKGAFVAQDGVGRNGKSNNFKLVPWEAIAKASRGRIAVGEGRDPRKTEVRRREPSK